MENKTAMDEEEEVPEQLESVIESMPEAEIKEEVEVVNNQPVF